MTVVVQLYSKDTQYGVLLHPNNSIAAHESVEAALNQYKDTLEEYQSRSFTWQASTALFKIEMESNVRIAEVEGDAFLTMMQQREHPVLEVGTSACRLRIADLTHAEIEPFLKDSVPLNSGE